MPSTWCHQLPYHFNTFSGSVFYAEAEKTNLNVNQSQDYIWIFIIEFDYWRFKLASLNTKIKLLSDTESN